MASACASWGVSAVIAATRTAVARNGAIGYHGAAYGSDRFSISHKPKHIASGNSIADARMRRKSARRYLTATMTRSPKQTQYSQKELFGDKPTAAISRTSGRKDSS